LRNARALTALALAGHALHRHPGGDPGHHSGGIFAFTLSWNEFIYALVFLSSPEQKTVPSVTSELIAAMYSSGTADGWPCSDRSRLLSPIRFSSSITSQD